MQGIIKKFWEEELNMVEIQGGFLTKGIRIPIPTFYISKLPITSEIWRSIMKCDSHRKRIEWYEYKQFAQNLRNLTHIKFFIPSDDFLDYAFEKNINLKDSILKTRQFLSIGEFNLETGIEYPIDEENISFHLTSSLGNGFDAIRLVIATKDNPNNHSYSKEDEENICDILNKINDIRSLQDVDTREMSELTIDYSIQEEDGECILECDKSTCGFNANLYLEAQDRWNTYQKALAEVKSGRIIGHWIWFIFPQMYGLGTSMLSRYYGILGREEAIQYINHPILRNRLVEITEAVFNNEKTVYEIFGNDAIKVRSCMLLFASVSDIPIFKRMIKKYGWK